MNDSGNWQIARFTAMGGPCEIRAYTSSPESVHCAIAEIERLERKYSRYLPDSVLSHINDSAGTSGISIDQETSMLLEYADHAWNLSSGKFDITSGVLRKVWDFKRGTVPAPDAVDAILERIGWQHVDIHSGSLILPEGMELDMGGLVKEYAADRALQVLRNESVACALVELSGDIAAAGPLPDTQQWLVRIRDPHDSDSHHHAAIEISTGAVATSGDYERCIEFDGVRYSHILDPVTGWPVRGLASVTVVHDSCLVAGTLATIAMLKGADGRAWLNEQCIRHYCIDT